MTKRTTTHHSPASWLAGVTLGLGLLATAAHAGGAIESVTGYVQGGAEVLRIELSEPLAQLPAGFAIQSPARIALDFPNVTNALGRSLVEINQGNLRTANVVEVGGRTRVVLNLKQATSYKSELQGNSVIVSLDPAGSVSASASSVAPSALPAAAASTDVTALKDLDFRRTTDGAGRVVLQLGSSDVGVDVQQQGKDLVLDIPRTALPEGLRRRLDVTDFGTPVQTITAEQRGERVRVTIKAVGDWEHSAYQSDQQFVGEVRAKKVDVNKLAQGPTYTGEKLSLNFQNIDVRSLLQVIADFTSFNIVTSDTVTGALTLRLKDVPWDQALQIIMDAKGLGMRKTGTVLWIAPKDEIDARPKKDLEAADAIKKLEPLRSQAFQLNYAKATDLVAQLTGGSLPGASAGGGSSNKFLSERGSVMAEPRTNQLFVTDIGSKLEEVAKLIQSLDVPVRQGMIEARIVEASDTFGRSLGVRLGGGDLRAQKGGDGGYGLFGGNRVAIGTDYTNATNSSGFGGPVNVGGNFVNMPAALSGVTGTGSFALSIFNSAANRFLTLELSAMEADGQGKIISSPRLVTADQTKALIEQGTEIPYNVTAANGATTIAFKKAVLKLEVSPQITPEGNIILNLDVNKDSVGQVTEQGVAIDTKHVTTQVLVENGGTVVIGGIFELEETNQVNKVPLLGDVPIVGNLFKNTTKTANKREMMVFITPKGISDRGPVR